MTGPPRTGTPGDLVGLRQYDEAADKTARLVLREYSTSFGWATRLLARQMRPHIANIYGLVRLADEIVDGPAGAAGLDAGHREELLDRLEGEVRAARRSGYSTNLVVHAFARTCALVDIDEALIAPFFASMRADISLTRCTPAEFDRYVHGSAEVIGLMCLRVFLGIEDTDRPLDPQTRERLEDGARHLGAAFQKINFLRDLGEDLRLRGRSYFPQVRDGILDDTAKAEISASIRADLDIAKSTLAELPRGARPGVASALRLFEELTDRIDRLPAARIAQERIRVPNLVKARIIAGALLGPRRTS